MGLEDILQVITEAVQDATSFYSVADQLRKAVSDDPENPLLPFIYAFSYDYVEDPEVERRERWGPYAPMIELADGRVFPPPLEMIDENMIDAWTQVYEQSDSPIVRARLGDLLWLRKIGDRPDLYARSAISSNNELGGGNWNELYRAYCLIRAFELSREIGDQELQRNIVERLLMATQDSIKSEEPKPGVTLRLLQPLLDLTEHEQPNILNEIIDTSFEVYADNPWILDSLFNIKAKRIPDQKQQLRTRFDQVKRWIEEAENSDGIIRMHNYQHALEITRNYGLNDLADEIRRTIQGIRPDELDLKEVTVSTEIPYEEVNRFIEAFIDKDDWRNSLSRFGAYGPPSGDHAENIREVTQQMHDHPLQFLITRTIYSENNFPIMTAQTEEEHLEIALIQHEMMGISIFGTLEAPKILSRIQNENDAITQTELVEFFTTPLITEDVAESIANSVNWYFEGEYEVSGHLLVPKIEVIIRNLARELGLAIFREPVGSTPGQVIPLGALLNNLRGKLDESWRRYFVNLLTNPIGMNLRNRICHGLIEQVTRSDVALLIHAACNLRLIRITEQE